MPHETRNGPRLTTERPSGFLCSVSLAVAPLFCGRRYFYVPSRGMGVCVCVCVCARVGVFGESFSFVVLFFLPFYSLPVIGSAARAKWQREAVTLTTWRGPVTAFPARAEATFCGLVSFSSTGVLSCVSISDQTASLTSSSLPEKLLRTRIRLPSRISFWVFFSEDSAKGRIGFAGIRLGFHRVIWLSFLFCRGPRDRPARDLGCLVLVLHRGNHGPSAAINRLLLNVGQPWPGRALIRSH